MVEIRVPVRGGVGGGWCKVIIVSNPTRLRLGYGNFVLRKSNKICPDPCFLLYFRTNVFGAFNFSVNISWKNQCANISY